MWIVLVRNNIGGRWLPIMEQGLNHSGKSMPKIFEDKNDLKKFQIAERHPRMIVIPIIGMIEMQLLESKSSRTPKISREIIKIV